MKRLPNGPEPVDTTIKYTSPTYKLEIVIASAGTK